MATYVVTYDLRKEENSDDYKPLIEAIKKLNGHKYQLSAWLVSSNLGAKSVFDSLSAHIDKNDALWVSEFTSDNWYVGALAGTNDWLKKHPPRR
ncbi:hypothetical protein [Methylobacterium radiotolerans]|uniref:hypothetical protein n=1 Tax=Methylobacterium radiotolerans TaxID=31998 RepID=UPI0015F47973|nr:hypothetical protein [Methylobacterium radiotolerans]